MINGRIQTACSTLRRFSRGLMIAAGWALLLGNAGLTRPVAKPLAKIAAHQSPNIPMPVSAPCELMHDATISSIIQPAHQRTVMMEVTAYCPCVKCCGVNAAGITANGQYIDYNQGQFVAADPAVPFGTKLVIPGYGNAAVEVIDRGSAIRGNKLDVFFPTHEQALKWGRRFVNVSIVD